MKSRTLLGVIILFSIIYFIPGCRDSNQTSLSPKVIESNKEAGVSQGNMPAAAKDFNTPGDNTHKENIPVESAPHENIANDNIDKVDAAPWPKGYISNIPELKGQIVAVKNGDKFKRVDLSYVEIETAHEFVLALKDGGYILNLNKDETAEDITYMGQNKKGEYIVFFWDKNKDAFVGMVEATEGMPDLDALGMFGYSEANPAEVITDMTDLAPWPTDFVPGVPELKGKIVEVEYEDDAFRKNCGSVTVDVWFAEREDVKNCIDEVKKLYVLDVSEGYEEEMMEYGGTSDSYKDKDGIDWGFASVYIYFSKNKFIDRYEAIVFMDRFR